MKSTISLLGITFLLGSHCLAMESSDSKKLAIRGHFTLRELLGETYAQIKLSDLEASLLNDVIIPLTNFDYGQINEILRGAYVIVPDNGALYESITKLPGTLSLDFSLYREWPSFVIKLPALGTLSTGLKNTHSWIRLQDSLQLKWLQKNPKFAFQLLDYSRALISKKTPNQGPFGFSFFTEQNPLVINKNVAEKI